MCKMWPRKKIAATVLWAFVTFNMFALNVNADEMIKWQQVTTGVQYAKKEYNLVDSNKTILMDIVRADPKIINIRVVDSQRTIEKSGRRYAAYSLKELEEILKPIAIINGAFTESFSFPIPAGLLVQHGKVTAQLNNISRLQSGILCINNENIKIIDRDEYKPGKCNYALQSGPKIVEYPGVNGIRTRQGEFTRSIVALDKNGRVLLIRTELATLYDLGNILTIDENKGGLSCIAALNLSGDVESGFLINFKEIEKSIGTVQASIASAITISAKK